MCRRFSSLFCGFKSPQSLIHCLLLLLISEAALLSRSEGVKGSAGESGLLHLPSLSSCLSRSQSLGHTQPSLYLVFKSIHHPSEWDLPLERVNNVWQSDREAYRMEDSLASISILSVSEGNREQPEWRMLGKPASADSLSSAQSHRVQGLESLFFFLFLISSLFFPFWL